MVDWIAVREKFPALNLNGFAAAQGVAALATVYVAYALDRNEEGNLLCVFGTPSHFCL